MKKILSILLVCLIVVSAWWFFSFDTNDTRENKTNDQTSTSSEVTPSTNQYVTATDPKSGIVFTYPADLAYEYVTLQDWPPKFVNSVDPINCELDEQTQAMSGATTSTQHINGNSYCVWETNEGAAGSVYTTYQLIYSKNGQYLTMSFVLRYPRCENYPTDQIARCQAEQDDFPLNAMIDTIAQSAVVPN